MNSKQIIQQFINETLLNKSNGNGIGPDDNLLMTNVIDSVGIMRLVTFLESHFEVRVNPADVTIENFRTATLIGAYVDQLRDTQSKATQ